MEIIMLSIHPIQALKDNYIWIIENGQGQAIAVDPGDARPVLRYLEKRQLSLQAILITHHHWDHVGGIVGLVNKYAPAVYGPSVNNIKGVDHFVTVGETIQFADFALSFEVLAIAGHTLDHICYIAKDMLFCGDTLFSAGCGRLFEGTPEMMLQSLLKLRALPPETRVYCAHEYTLNNLNFAKSIDPKNAALLDDLCVVQKKCDAGEPTLPSTIKREKQINPFLRVDDKVLIDFLQKNHDLIGQDPVTVFTLIRQLKDQW